MRVLQMTDLELAGKRVLIREDLNVPVRGRRGHRATRASAPALPTAAASRWNAARASW